MGNYTKSTDFAIKDNLGITNPAKVIKGTEFDSEFNAIQSAVNSKAEAVNSNLTGTTQIATLRLAGVDVTATSAELNKLDGVTASTAEINTLVGVTSPIQDQIDTKFGSSGGSVTGNITLDDNIGLRLGTNADLVMFSDGSDSFITEQGTNGSLFVKSNGDGIIFRDAANANYASMLQSTGEVKLFHIDTGIASTRLTTSATGVTVNGETATDTVKLGLWNIKVDTNELVFEYDGTDVFKLGTDGAVTSADNITAFGTV